MPAPDCLEVLGARLRVTLDGLLVVRECAADLGADLGSDLGVDLGAERRGDFWTAGEF